MKPFCTTSINEFELVSNDISYLIEQYAQINQFLKSNFPEPYHFLLAKPEKIGAEINWYSTLPGDIQRIEDFNAHKKSELLCLYNARKHEIENACEKLSKTDDFDRQLWAKILQSVFNPNHIFLFSNGQEIVLTWGIKTHKSKDYFIPFDEYKSALLVPEKAQDSQSPIEEKEELTEESLDLNEAPSENHTSKPTNPQEAETSTPITSDHSSADFEEIIPQSGPQESQPANPKIADPDKETEPLLYHQKLNPKNEPHKEKHWFYAFLDNFERFAGRYWWLLLVIGILLLWLLLDRCDSGDSITDLSDNEIEEIYDEIMPEIPRQRIIPIDSTDFRTDDSTGNIIVAGLLNLALVENPKQFKRMAVELKQNFSDDKYKIVYYDEQTSRLQFNFPEEETASIRTAIKTKLPQYDVLMWDESVFQSNRRTNDPYFNDVDKTWHMKAINLEKAWDITMGDTSVCIAVIDDGFDMKHNEFKGKNIQQPYNVVTDNSRVYASDAIFHGTHVAGLALGNANNNTGGSGVAPNCSFMPVQIGSGEEFFTMTDVVDGVLYALNHDADVINMSLGKAYGDELQGSSPSELEQIINETGKDEEEFWKTLFKMAAKKNAIIVLAAGNENLLIGMDPMQRSDEVVKVVAVDNTLKKADFSNYCKGCMNKNTFISAPGVRIYSSIPKNKFMPLDGTSMAAPIVTGAIALMKSANPNLKNKDILRILQQSSKKLPDRSCPPFLQVDVAVKKARGN